VNGEKRRKARETNPTMGRNSRLIFVPPEERGYLTKARLNVSSLSFLRV
jgi:hypothetical protein